MRASFLRQGGGFYITGGDVQLTSCNIYSNEATTYVSTRPHEPELPLTHM
jgi:hypothetical protein